MMTTPSLREDGTLKEVNWWILENPRSLEGIAVSEMVIRHYGPGTHPGTGTDQAIHSGNGRGQVVDPSIPDDIRAMSFYHGTDSVEEGEAILESGLIKAFEHNRPEHDLTPISGRAYLTPDLEYALIYALGANMAGHDLSKFQLKHGERGYIFEINTDDLNDIQPDEDSIGRSLWSENYPWLNRMAERELSRETYREVMDGEYASWARAGKQLVRSMDAEDKWQLIRDGAALANAGDLRISRAWVFNKKIQPQFPRDRLSGDTEAAKKKRVQQILDLLTETETVERHYGPGDHPGTGTPQTVHAPGGAKRDIYVGVPADREKYPVGMKPGLMSTENAYQPSGAPIRGHAVMDVNDPRIPDHVYHMTTNLSGILESGEISARGVGGLGGDKLDQIVSMTLDEDIARNLAADTRVVIQLSQEMLPSEPQYVFGDEVEEFGAPYRDRNTGEPISQAQYEQWSKNVIRRLNELDTTDHGDWDLKWDLGFAQSYNLHDWIRQYYTIRGHRTDVKNPLFFTDPEIFATYDPSKVGVVRIPKENLDTGALLMDFDLDNDFGLSEVRLYGDVPLDNAEPIDGEITKRHYGPGTHPGTGTDQTVHAPDGAGGVSPATETDFFSGPTRVYDKLKDERMKKLLRETLSTIEANMGIKLSWVTFTEDPRELAKVYLGNRYSDDRFYAEHADTYERTRMAYLNGGQSHLIYVNADNLVDVPDDEVIYAYAHEIGHYMRTLSPEWPWPTPTEKYKSEISTMGYGDIERFHHSEYLADLFAARATPIDDPTLGSRYRFNRPPKMDRHLTTDELDDMRKITDFWIEEYMDQVNQAQALSGRSYETSEVMVFFPQTQEAVSYPLDEVEDLEHDEIVVLRHYGPGTHPGTGTDQTVHSPDGAGGGASPSSTYKSWGDLLKVPKTDRWQPVRDAFDLISQVHEIPRDNLLPIPIKASRGLERVGFYRYYQERDGSFTPKDLFVQLNDAYGNSSLSTTVHELGHYLDQQGWVQGKFASRLADHGALQDLKPEVAEAWESLHQAIKDSDYYERLYEFDPDVVEMDPPDEYYVMTNEGRQAMPENAVLRINYDFSLKRNRLQPEELFARAYMQYIATKTNDYTLQRDIARHADFETRGAMPRYWTAEEFDPVMEAMDELFRTSGWLNE